MERVKLQEIGRRKDVILLRPHSLSKETNGGDFDFLAVESEALGIGIIRKFGTPIIEIKRQYVHQRFYEWGQIDVLPGLEWNGHEYADAGLVLKEARIDADGIRRPRLGHDGVISWLTSLLWGGFFKEKYRGVIQRAAEEDRERFEKSLEWALGKQWAGEMLEWVRDGRLEESAKYVKEIRRALKWQNFRRSGGETISRVSCHWLTEAKHHLSPQLPLIAFLGPDGSGKSSVIDGIRKKLDQMGIQQRMMHWRPYGLKGREDLGVAVADPHSSPPRGWLQSVAKLGMLWWDWWVPSLTVLRHARAKTSVVFSDRYYDDLPADPVRYRYGASAGLARFAFRFFPKPDLVFVLTGTAEVIHPRKEEVTLDELRKQLIRYREIASRLGAAGRPLNVDRPLAEVVEEATTQFLGFLRGEVNEPRVTHLSERSLRVAQFVPHYPSLEGLSAYCRGLSKEMNKLLPGSCPIITLREELKYVSGEEELLHYPSVSRNPMSLPKELLRDLKSDKHKLDGIVFHGPYHPKVAMLRRFLEKNSIPYIFVPHDPYVPELTEHHAFRKFVFWHLFEKHTIKGAKAIQILAPEHEEPLRKKGFTVPVEEIPNGCELETLAELPKQLRVPGENEEIRIQYMGRMDRNHKGLDLLILAFADYAKENPTKKVELVLTGNDWEDREELEKLANKSGQSELIRFTGPRKEHSLAIHAEADLVILPSRFDGFGLTIVEAMLASRPVLVSSRAGAASHVLKAEGGWVFDPEIPKIKEALKEAIAMRHEWKKMGDANHQYVVNHLTWKITAQKTLNMYRRYFK